MAKLYWSTHTPQLARMAPSSHPGHGDGHTLGSSNGLPAKLRAGSQIPSVKGYNIFPCFFPCFFQGYGALVKLEGPTPHPVDFQLVTETSTASEQVGEDDVEFHLPDRVNRSHTLRKGERNITRHAMDWNPQGTRKRSRPRTTWRRSIQKDLKEINMTWCEAKRAAQD